MDFLMFLINEKRKILGATPYQASKQQCLFVPKRNDTPAELAVVLRLGLHGPDTDHVVRVPSEERLAVS